MPFLLWVGTGPQRKARLDPLLPKYGSLQEQLLPYLAEQQPMRDLDGTVRLHHSELETPFARLREVVVDDALVGIELSLSLSAPHHPMAVREGMSVAVRLAQLTNGKCFEPLHQHEITSANLAELMPAKAPYMSELMAIWIRGVKALSSRHRGYLELPIGWLDDVEDYFSFTIRTQGEPPSLAELVANTPSSSKVDLLRESALLIDPERSWPLVRILRGKDRVVVRPEWWWFSFDHLARATLEAVARVEELLGTAAEYYGNPLTPALRKETTWRASGFGVDFRQWVLDAGRDGPIASTKVDGSPRTVRLGGGAVDPKREAWILETLSLARGNDRPVSATLELALRPDMPFAELQKRLHEMHFRRAFPWGPHQSSCEPVIASWEDPDQRLRYERDTVTGARRLTGNGPGVGALVDHLDDLTLSHRAEK